MSLLDKAWYDKHELAEYLGLSLSRVHKMVANEELPYYRLGEKLIRFKRDDVDQYLEKRKNLK
jgi:excisionase family DNA binding protein